MRIMTKNNVIALDRCFKNFDELNVPKVTQAAQRAASWTTLPVERFFPRMRGVWPIPYLLQYMGTRATVVFEHSKEYTTKAFSYWTGHTKKGHYAEGRSAPTATAVKIPKPQPAKGNKEQRQRDLRTCRDAAGLLKGVPQLAVTARAKEISGSAPYVMFTVPDQFASAGPGPGQSAVSESDERAPHANNNDSQIMAGESQVHYRSGSLVYVKPARGSFEAVFLVQLLDPVVEVKTWEPRRG